MFVKCPKCELNYMDSNDRMCKVCYREIYGSDMPEEPEMCGVCNEAPALPGKDICALCLKEMGQESVEDDGDAATSDEAGPMDEISPDISGNEEIPEPEFPEIDNNLSLEELEEKEGNESDDDEDDEQ